MLDKFINQNYLIIKQSWYFLSALLAAITLLEWWSPGLVLMVFNPLFLLILWLIGAIILLWSKPVIN